MNIIEAIDEWADAMEKVAKAARAISKVATTIIDQTQGLKEIRAVAIEEKSEEPAKKKAAPKEDIPKTPDTEHVTVGMIRTVLAEKSQAGLTSKVKELLNSYGAEKLSALKPEDYRAVYEAAKEL